MARRPKDQATLSGAMETLRADYSASKTSRFRRTRTGVPSAGAGADYHYRSDADYLKLMEMARDFDRNDVLVGSIVDRAVTNAVQGGIQIDPDTGDEGLNADLKAEFASWAADCELCDLACENEFASMQWLALRHTIVDGDVVSLLNRSGAVEQVEGHRVRTPRESKAENVVHGVQIEKETRKRVQYWLTRDEVTPSKTVNRADMKRYDTRAEDGHRQVCHVYSPKRITQTRGVTAFAPIFDQAGMFEDIAFAKLVQQQMVACFAVIEERQLGFKVPTTEAATGKQTEETDADGVPRTLEGMGPGMLIKGAPGAKIHLDSANVPNPEFFPHMRLVIQLIGINLGMPLVLALMDASETNFSGWRGAMDQAKLGFQRNQAMLYMRLIKPVYEWHLRRLILIDAAIARAYDRLGKTFFHHVPGYPTWPYVEPLKDASADLLETRNALLSHRRRCARRNMDWDDLSTEIVEDNGKLILKAEEKRQQLIAQHPDLNVTWREVACLPTPDGMTVSAAAAMDNDGRQGAAQGQDSQQEES